MLVLDAYSYVFYRLYRFSSRWKNDVTPPQVTAFLGIIAIVWCSIFLFLVIVDTMLAPADSVIPHLSRFDIYLSFAVLAAPLYFVFLHRRKYLQIAARYELETPRQRCVRGIIIISTLVLLWVLIVFFSVLHRGRVHPSASNQPMKPTAPPRNAFGVFATTPCRGLSLSR